MTPTFFPTPADFRNWLEENHEFASELVVGFYKKDSGKTSITWPESVEEALCFGWIDGVRRTLGPDSYMIRFTPRRRGSIWSEVNLRTAEKLIESGRMRPAGVKVFQERDPAKSGVYSFEQRSNPQLPPKLEGEFKSHSDAWAYFQSQPAGYRRLALWWIVSAKQEATRLRRLQTLIADSANHLRLAPFRRSPTGRARE
jgi:uncharacterized protein YdeI (YjbR/CyaY-like superfamily)